MFSIDLPPDSSWKWETEYSEGGHNRPCHYCGELCNNYAGNPGEWSVGFPEKDEPGKVKYHHMDCLLRKLNRLEELEQSSGILCIMLREAKKIIEDNCPDSTEAKKFLNRDEWFIR